MLWFLFLSFTHLRDKIQINMLFFEKNFNYCIHTQKLFIFNFMVIISYEYDKKNIILLNKN